MEKSMSPINVSPRFDRRRLLPLALVLGLALALFALTFGPALIAFAQPEGGPGWFENFDSYATGSQMHGQGGWQGWDNAPAAGALVTDVVSLSAPNSVDIVGLSDLVHQYPGYDSGVWLYTAWQYIPTGYFGDSYFIMQNTYNDGGPYDWSVQIHFDSATGMVGSDSVEGFSQETPFFYDTWMPIRVLIDLEEDHQQVYYGDVLVAECSWTTCQPTSAGVLAIGAVDLFANGATSVYYDNLSLTRIPDLSITKEASDTLVEPGDPLSFVINYNNNSLTDTAGTVNVADLIPDELTNVSFTSSGNITATGDLTYTWEVGPLGPGDSGTITVTGTVDPDLVAEGVFTNTATISPTFDISATNNSAVAVVEVNIAPTVNAGSDQQVDPGDLVQFSGSFTDLGGDDTHTYEWNIDGDIVTGTLTPTHTFNDPGIYQVTLTVTDSDGGVGVDTVEITVGTPMQFIYLPAVVYTEPQE